MSRCSKKDLYIIFEGITEEKFINRIGEFFNLKSNINIIMVNASGAENIIREYKVIKKKNYYSDIVVMYDLDGCKNIDQICNLYKEKDIELSKREIYFINPKFELLFVLCKKNKVPINNYALYMKDLYFVENYKKKDKQISKIISMINKNDILEMMKRINRLMSTNDNDIRSTNYGKLFSNIFNID